MVQWCQYHFHGIDVLSEISLDLPFSGKQRAGESLSICLSKETPPLLARPVYESPQSYDCGRPWVRLFKLESGPVYEIPYTGTFVIRKKQITFYPETGVSTYPVPYLLGRVFGLWLELTDFVVLHGSCLAFKDAAVGVLGESGRGKSTFSTALLDHGLSLLSDDLLPLHDSGPPFSIAPGIPQTRMWPDSGRFFLPNYDEYDRVHPHLDKRKLPGHLAGHSRFTANPQPLKLLFLLQREGTLAEEMVRWERLKPARALTELIRLSFNGEACQALGLQSKRLRLLARLVSRIPVVKLYYRSGFEHLAAVSRQFLRLTESLLGESAMTQGESFLSAIKPSAM